MLSHKKSVIFQDHIPPVLGGGRVDVHLVQNISKQKGAIPISILTENIDAHPYTGVRQVKGRLRFCPETPKYSWLDNHFNGCDYAEQVHDVTRGREYEVISVEGFGDMENVTFIDDKGNPQTLCDVFFEEIDDAQSG